MRVDGRARCDESADRLEEEPEEDEHDHMDGWLDACDCACVSHRSFSYRSRATEVLPSQSAILPSEYTVDCICSAVGFIVTLRRAVCPSVCGCVCVFVCSLLYFLMIEVRH